MLRYEPFIFGGQLLRTEALTSSIELGLSSERRTREWATFVSMITLLASDLSAVIGAAGFGYLIWADNVLHQPLSDYLELLPLLVLFPAVYASAGLYPGFGLGAVETLRRIFYGTFLGFLILAAVSFAFKANPIYSRVSSAITLAGALILVPLFRLGALSVASGLRWWGYPTVVVGSREVADLTIKTLRQAFSLGYRVVGVVLPSSTKIAPGETIDGIPVLGGVELAPRLSGAGVRAALVWDSPEALTLVANLQRHFPRVVLIRDERNLPIEHLRVRNLGGVLGIEFTCQLFHATNQIIKRAIDLILGTLLLIASLPIILIGGLAIKLVSPGPMFFSQEREGLHGEIFKVLKLRTMYQDAEQRLEACLAGDPELRRQWLETMKLNPDPRIIPGIGNWLRRFSIDELPQLFAVVAGSMSLVGPRPFPQYHLKFFGPEFRELRTLVRPGLTGMWQVMVRSSGDIRAQELYDNYYIRNWSLWLDLYILAKTGFAVIAGSGAC